MVAAATQAVAAVRTAGLMLASQQSLHRANGVSDFDAPVELAGHRAFFVTSVLLFVASATITVFWCNSMSGGMTMPGGWTLSMIWMRMPGQSWFGAAASFLVMWAVMMVAMMLPVLIPALLRYRQSYEGSQSTSLAALTAIAGAAYIFVWVVLGAALYPFGIVLAKTVMASELLAQWVPIAASIILLLAGYVQLTRWKVRQLRRCQLAFAGGKALTWNARGAWDHGIRLGTDCARCCCGLMAVMLVSGIMNLGIMALVTVAIAAERLVWRPERVARTTGIILIASAVFVIGKYLSY
jgi:predicted metal-binding membrane protein